MSLIRRFTAGWLADLPDGRDRQYAAPFFLRDLPPRVDLRAGFPPVYDQGELGSCVAQAVVGAMQYNQIEQHLPELMLSRLALYYHAREKLDTVAVDSGAMIRDGIKVAAKLGVCPEELWPYDIEQFAVEPPPPTVPAALEHQVLTYARVMPFGRALRAALASEDPVVCGISVYASFMTETVAATGDVPMPESDDSLLGGHAIVLVGYDDETERVAWRNSYGPMWGAGGYGTLPYRYLTEGYGSDFWVIRKIE